MIEIRNQEYVKPSGTRPTRIVAAAILYEGKIWTGKNHGILIRQIIIDTSKGPRTEHQGFLTDDNRFVSRKVARIIAKNSGQVPESFNKNLTSEDFGW